MLGGPVAGAGAAGADGRPGQDGRDGRDGQLAGERLTTVTQICQCAVVPTVNCNATLKDLLKPSLTLYFVFDV